jgi:hypothetical protein
LPLADSLPDLFQTSAAATSRKAPWLSGCQNNK